MVFVRLPSLLTSSGSSCSLGKASSPSESVAEKLNCGRRAYSSLLPHDVTSSFASDVELAARGALFLTLAGIPLLFGLDKRVDFFSDNALFSTGTIVMFIYTVYKSVGETVHFAFEAMVGTLLASLAGGLLFLAFPEGAAPGPSEDAANAYGFASGVLVVVIVLWLNFSALAQIFMLSNYVYYWMSFMNPAGRAPHDVTWLGVHYYHVVGMANITTGFCGCSLAVLVTLMPYPKLAIQKARNTATATVHIFGESWETAIRLYFSCKANRYERSRMRHDMMKIQVYVATLKSDVSNSWWEAMLIPQYHKVRQLLIRLDEMAGRNMDCLTHIINSCTREDFSDSHNQLMAGCKELVEAVTGSALALLQSCTSAVCSGGLRGPSDRQMIASSILQVREGMQTLTDRFRAVKHRLQVGHLDTKLIDEHVFCISACSFCRNICDFAEALLEESEVPRPRRKSKVGIIERLALKLCAYTKYATSIVDTTIIFDRNHANFALRNSLTIIFCMTIGYFGAMSMIKPYTAEIAGTASVLLSRCIGSSLTKNLGRLQGVVLGLIVGELAYSILGWCEWWAFGAMSLVIFLWVWCTLFLYFNSTTYSYMGCLMAAFGAQQFLRGCSPEPIKPELSYYKVINCVVAILTITAVDMVFSLGRPSLQALDFSCQALSDMHVAVNNLFGLDVQVPDFPRADIMTKLSSAVDFGEEAALEPRFWRAPWPHHTFKTVLKCVHEVRLNLNCIVNVVVSSGAEKDQWFQRMLSYLPFQNAVAALTAKLELAVRLVERLEHDKYELHELLMQSDSADSMEFMESAIQALIACVNDDEPFWRDFCKGTLEDNRAAQVSFVISCMYATMESLQALQDAVLAE